MTSRIGPESDRIIVAQLSGIVCRYARWEPPDAATAAAAVAELQEIANGCADLLAEVAGLALGFDDGTPDAPRAANKAAFCRLAGADETPQIPGWAEIGRERAAQALLPPFSQSRQRRPPGLR